MAGSGEKIDWVALGWTSLGTFGAAACANALNQLYEVVNDSRMTRTANRPLPGGRLTALHAAAFAAVMGAAGIGILYEKVRGTPKKCRSCHHETTVHSLARRPTS